MPKLHCDNIACSSNRKHGCTAEEVVINLEGLCMTLDDISILEEQDEFKEEND